MRLLFWTSRIYMSIYTLDISRNQSYFARLYNPFIFVRDVGFKHVVAAFFPAFSSLFFTFIVLFFKLTDPTRAVKLYLSPTATRKSGMTVSDRGALTKIVLAGYKFYCPTLCNFDLHGICTPYTAINSPSLCQSSV